MLLGLVVPCMPAVAQQFDVERSGRPHSPVRDPISAWQRARQELEPGARVRRLAFADHILFVFHSDPDSDRIRSLALTPTAEGFEVEDDGERDATLCHAEGVDAARVEHALRRVVDSEPWQRDRARMNSLILECMGPELVWTLMPIPDGGFRAGVAIDTVSVPFEPGVQPTLPDLER